MCPAITKLHVIITRLEVYAMLGALLYVVILFPWAEPIRESTLQLAALFLLAQVLGKLSSFARLPPLLGMLLAGIILRQVKFFHAEGSFLKFTATVRYLKHLTFILFCSLYDQCLILVIFRSLKGLCYDHDTLASRAWP